MPYFYRIIDVQTVSSRCAGEGMWRGRSLHTLRAEAQGAMVTVASNMSVTSEIPQFKMCRPFALLTAHTPNNTGAGMFVAILIVRAKDQKPSPCPSTETFLKKFF